MRRLTSKRWAALALVSALALAGCSSKSTPLDAGKKKDLGVVSGDGPVIDDQGVKPDSGVNPDSAVKKDTGVKNDTGVKSDTGVKKDTGTKADTGVKKDGTVVGDGGPQPTNAKCSAPQTVTLAATGVTTINGSTAGVADEFAGVDCGNGNGPWPAGQLYYKLALKAGKLYLIKLTSKSDLSLYAFPSATACTETAINTACAPTSADTIPDAGKDNEETLILAPKTDTDYTLVVDSYQSSENGPFTVTVEPLTSPANSTCAAAEKVTLAATGPTTIKATTKGAADEFATISCGNANGPWPGGQTYYEVTLVGGKKYSIKLDATPDLSFYAFPKATACSATAIEAACKNPTPADPQNIYNSDKVNTGKEEIRIAPPAGANQAWVIVVDSWDMTTFGDYTLTINEYVVPANITCGSPSAAQTVPAIGSALTIAGDTTGVKNDITGVNCGNAQVGPFDMGQTYHTVTLGAGKTYQARLTPTFNAALYAFPKTTACNTAGINAACTNPTPADPFNAYYSDRSTSTGDELVALKPAAGGDWIFVVDSKNADGAYSLAIKEFTAPTNGKCSAPQVVALTTSPVTLNADTSLPGAPNEYAVDCKHPDGPWPGPQLYYKVTLQANKKYTFTLKPTNWDAAFYAFPASTSCDAVAINAACTNPTPADPGNVFNSDNLGAVDEVLVITPKAAGDWILVVDGWSATSASGAGAFSITATF